MVALSVAALGVAATSIPNAVAREAHPYDSKDGDAEITVVVGVVDIGRLVVNANSSTELIEVIGINPENGCYRAFAIRWAQAIFSRSPRVYLYRDPAYVASARRVAFGWKDNVVDFAAAAIRSGNAKHSDHENRYRDYYARVESEAMAEHRGLWARCESPLRPFSRTARFSGFPAEILYGIAMNETALNGKPWPWTLNVAGRGYYFNDRMSAWRAAEYLRGHDFDMFDIGVMQVNWHYHGHLFANSWDALDPEINQRAAASILAGHLRRTGSLAQAIGRYHSASPNRAKRYVEQFALHYAAIRETSEPEVTWGESKHHE
jgi:hypothetical protein